nr:MAG: hypothetical protein DIU70_12880 [Bacillota bacterium]
MSPIQALAWAYTQLKSGDPPPPDMKRRYVAAMRKYLNSEDGLLTETPIWVRPYQLLFEPQSQPADLLLLLRPPHRSTE